MLRHRTYTAIALAASACVSPDSLATPTKVKRPNVVLVITDDQGIGDLGFHGNPVLETPRLDALAASSARLASFYVSPVCAPTRAALMTGRWTQRTHVTDTWIGRAMLEPEETTVAEVLRDAGFATGIFGKWHLGDCYPMRPQDQGFEHALVHRGGGIGQPSDPEGGEGKYTNAVLFEDGERRETRGYCTDVYFDAAIEWMREQRESERPFFAYIATNAPHGPFHDVPPELLAKYQAMDLSPSRFPRTRGHALPDQHDEDRLARIFAMVENIDQNVGKLVDALEAMGELEDTLVLFLVDNGPNTRRYVMGMRGNKSHVHEGGVRSPLFAHWPARLEPGESSAHPAAHIDLMPTILDACGVPVPDGLALDGRSVLPLLEGQPADWSDRLLVLQAHRGARPIRYEHFMARTDRWKLVNATGFGPERDVDEAEQRFELYDLARDPLELHDLAATSPEEVATMRAAYDAWFDDVTASAALDPEPRIVIGNDAELETHLTRQDWEQLDADQGWGRRSFGAWHVRVEDAGPYDVRLRFVAGAEITHARLRVGDAEFDVDVPVGAVDVMFEALELPLGEARLVTELTDSTADKGVTGAYQVVVTR